MRKTVALSNNLLSWLNSFEEESKTRKELDERLQTICKPCWELKYCPYGALVEDYPLPPLTINNYIEHLEYIKQCLEHNAMGDDFSIPLDDWRRASFEKEIENNDLSGYVEEVSNFEKEASCKVFGHLCPVFFVYENCTETSTERNHSRNIHHSTLIRVARRDNNTCQICGRVLLDSEIEIDHIIPFSRGGTTDENNLRVTCRDCNRKKGGKIEH